MAGVTHSQRPPRVYPRTARLNRLMREIVADELERIDDERLDMWPSRGRCRDGIQHAPVWFRLLCGPEATTTSSKRSPNTASAFKSAIGAPGKGQAHAVALVPSRHRRPSGERN